MTLAGHLSKPRGEEMNRVSKCTQVPRCPRRLSVLLACGGVSLTMLVGCGSAPPDATSSPTPTCTTGANYEPCTPPSAATSPKPPSPQAVIADDLFDNAPPVSSKEALLYR